MTQAQALAILKTGANAFLTGAPGSGKTHLINEYVAYLRARDVDAAITASTGIAATHIGGMTIHSWSGIGIKDQLTKHDLQAISSNRYVAKRVRRVKILIIDEVSMLAPDKLVMIDRVCRRIKERVEPFGGIQVIFVGDFFQLPPITNAATRQREQTTLMSPQESRFAYAASLWMQAKPVVCYLTEQYRQDDADFLSLLSAIRSNKFIGDHIRHIESRKIAYHEAPNGAPKLFSHNVDVDRVNNSMLARIPGNPNIFEMSSQGPRALVAALTQGCLSPERLLLKNGAAVMFTKNNMREGFVNGTLGAITGFDKHTGYPIVTTRKGKRIEVEPMEWIVEEGGSARASITQLPLRLAWAITVHKSQGMSLDEAVMDLGNVFEYGQGYVALSRVRRLSGLHLLGWNKRAFEVHPDVVAQDRMFQESSREAENALAGITSDALKQKHKAFIAACGGKECAEETASENKAAFGAPFAKIRERHPNAYKPWDPAQDESLRASFTQGESIGALARLFGRKKGGVRSRLVKLGLIDQTDQPFSNSRACPP